MADFVAPFTYGSKWLLFDKDGKSINYEPTDKRESEVDSKHINEILNPGTTLKIKKI